MNRRLVPLRAWLALLPLVVLSLPASAAAGVEVEVVRYRVAVPDPATRLFRVRVRAGDVLLAVGEVEVGSDSDWGDRFISQYAGQEGAALPLRVGRDGKDQVLVASVRLQRQVQYRVTPDPHAGELERRILESLVARQ